MRFASPAPVQVIAARKNSGLTQQQAAEVVDVEPRSWQYWESGGRAMPPGIYRLFCILTNQGDPKAGRDSKSA